MGDLFDYLSWRGDLSLDRDPFNEVDNLILAELAYTDFEGVFDEEREYSVREACQRYYSLHTREEVEARTTMIGHAPLLLEPMAASERFKNLTISGYVNVVDETREEQFAAMVYRIRGGGETQLVYVAFRGTDNNLVGWKEDFNLSYLNETPAQARAVEYLEQHMGATGERFTVGGHSKGGNLAIYASAFCSPALRERIDRVYSNDGPGFREEILESGGYQEILPRVVSFVPEMSVVGMLLNNSLSHQVVKSSQTGILQHDALSWQVLGNRFVRLQERSEASQFLDNALRGWIGGLRDDEKQQFVDLLFGLFDAPGEHTLEGLQKSGLRSVGDIWKAVRELPAQERKQFNATFRKLLYSGGRTFFEDLREGLQEKYESSIATEKRETAEQERPAAESDGPAAAQEG